jgi:hypothetical protein
LHTSFLHCFLSSLEPISKTPSSLAQTMIAFLLVYLLLLLTLYTQSECIA